MSRQMSGTTGRLAFLDGLRGVAILMVLAYHAYARWPNSVPYGTTYADLWPAQFGYLGVQLFFLISGFVILMTLEKTGSLGEFMQKRWLRLFPGMAICSLIIFTTADALSARPAGPPVLRDVLPGLLFMWPSVLSAVFSTSFQSLDGAFWSLYVEVVFYAVVGLIYFWRGRGAALLTLCVIQVAGVVVDLLPMPAVALTVSGLFGATHFGWFLAGALLYLHFRGEGRRYLVMSLIAICMALLKFRGLGETMSAAAVAAVFVLSVAGGVGRSFLAWRPLATVGVASYPLYLLHQNITIAAVAQLSPMLPWFPAGMLPIVVTLPLLAGSWLIATRGEPWLRGVLATAIAPMRLRGKTGAG